VQEEMGKFVRHLDDATNSVQQLEEAQKVLSEAMANVSAVSEEASATSQEVASLTVEQLGASDGLVQLAEQLETLSKSLQESLSRFELDKSQN
jgi:methyl-accepting chemotaxis protein